MNTHYIKCNESTPGESLETKLQRATENGEPIKADIGLIYTEEKEGVLPAYDIRTDRFDVALQATDKVNQAIIAMRDNLPNTNNENNAA